MSQDATLIRDALAERLGLTVKPGGLEGTVDGAPVQVRVSVIRQSHGHGQVAVFDLGTGTVQPVVLPLQLSVEVQLPFQPRLDAGLAVGPAGGHAALVAAGRVGAQQRLVVKGSEVERARSLLSADVLERLDRSFVGDPGPKVTDDSLSWRWSGAQPWPSVDLLAEAIGALPGAWSGIRAAARTCAPPTSVADAYLVLAGMELVPGVEPWGCPAGVVGEVDGVGVSVTVAPFHTGGWTTRATVRLPKTIPGGPKVVREDRFGWFERLAATIGGKPELEVGDERFDRRFAIRTLKPEALSELLHPDVRQAMLALDGLIAVQLGPTAIEGRGPLTKEKDLVHVVQATLALARFVADRA